MTKRQAILVFVLLLVKWGIAQNSTLFLMPELPQSNFVNPAVQSTYKWVIGIPALASFQGNHLNTISSFNDAFYRREDGSSALDYDRLISGLSRTEFLEEDHNYTMLFVGFHLKDHYFTFALNEKVAISGTFPAEVMQALWEGNSNHNSVTVDGLSLNAEHLREYVLGWSHKLYKPLTLGVHAKVLFGKGNVYLRNVTGTMITLPNDYGLALDVDASVHSTLPIDLISDEEGNLFDVSFQKNINWWDYATNRQNLGLGFDVGFIYEKDKKTSFSGSLLNVGAVAWKSNSNGLTMKGQYEFSGFEDSRVNYLESILDSIENHIPVKTNGEDYKSLLIPEIYLGASQIITPHLQVGVGFYGRVLPHRWQPALGLSLNTYGYKRISAALSYTAVSDDYFNVGAGLGVLIGPIHIHMVSDNVLGMFALANNQFVNFRFGLSYVINKKLKPSGCNCFNRWEGRKERAL